MSLRKIVSVCVAVTGLVACDNQYETIFKQSPDDRLREKLGEYTSILVDAPYGWKASLYTGSGAGYFYYFDFNENGNVTMLSDFDETAAGEPMESTWALKALQRPTLSFTTYSYVHLPADPDGNVNNGIPGSGLLSDFEFAIVSTSEDSVVMKGTKHNSEIILVKTTEQEKQAFYGKRIQLLLQQTEDYLASSKGYRLLLPNGLEIPMALSIPYKLISFQYLDADGETIRIPRTSYTFSIDGILLREAIEVYGFDIDRLVWNDAGYYEVPFSEPVSLTPSDDPYIFNPATPLYTHLGNKSVIAVIPRGVETAPLPGQSDEFIEAYNYAVTQMLEGPYRLTLQEIQFVFVPSTDRMLMILTVTQPVNGGGVARFTAQYTYSYQVRDGGVLKFRLEGSDGNAGILYPDMIGILSHFDNDTFRAEYVGGGFDLLAGFFSQEEPGYYFSGYLEK